MSNNSTNAKIINTEAVIVGYYSLFLVIIGTVFNLLTFIILCQPLFRNTKKLPAMHYMRTIAIFDIFMLYGWNFDHYLSPVHGFTLLNHSIISCRFFSFLNYFAAQSSAWLRVFICFERYLSLNRLNRTWFSRSKGILIIIGCIIGVFSGFNFHFLLFACFYKKTGGMNINAQLYKIYPLWDYINLGIYNCVPFVFMVIFNSGVIYQLIHRRRITTVQNCRIQHRSVSITLVITTFLFSLMTTPANVGYAFFSTTSPIAVLHALDSILYTYHITSFPLYLITFGDFRRECIAMFTCSINNRQVAPVPPIILEAIPCQKLTTVKIQMNF